LIIHFYQKQKKYGIFRLDLIRIITLFFEVNWYEKIKITFF